MNKSQIRKKILKIRKQKKIKKFNFNFDIILSLLKRKKVLGKIIGGYYPYNYEIDILQILEKFEKKKFILTLPKIKKNSQMNFFQWSTKDPLVINKFGIPEPISKMIKYPDVLLVPLVAFDKNFNRIGYGGGFYDRYIKKVRKRKVNGVWFYCSADIKLSKLISMCLSFNHATKIYNHYSGL